ncbi:GDSL esterase/lipase At5g03610-like [Andrographis paniculata]|uniref:GDSL esterase/lipase At5g03610-like n=1 Tax=Andrographis paniculata TaxID=175694 RepID=UPI0021E904DE|nr:GDSL esterase/lipase At5g03610-like [Andrographis paniculata]
MEPSNLSLKIIFFLCCFLLTSGSGIQLIQGSPLHRHRHRHRHRHQVTDGASRPTKLFVFGDSYADTGNIRKSFGGAWKDPYGSTFPGKPAGRFSDGRVLTDYIAKFLGLKSPLAYEWRKYGGKKFRNGMNFAYGGSGVFDTLADILPNMTTQIGFFENLIDNNNLDHDHDHPLYVNQDLQCSVFLVSLTGNDYGAYLNNGGTMEGIRSFIPRVINQLTLNLNRMYELGARRVLVTALPPLGCLPQMTAGNSFQRCNATQNSAVGYHNLLLQQAVAELNNETRSSTFFVVDLYSTFERVLDRNGGFESGLKPCCVANSAGYFCGSVDENGKKMYTVCSDPKSAFFWDSSHPTEAGWEAVFMNLQSSLQQFFGY